MHTDDDRPRRRTVRLRSHVLTEARLQALGYTSLSDLALRSGLSHTTLLRARDGAVCGPAVIGALTTATGLPFESLFKITDG